MNKEGMANTPDKSNEKLESSTDIAEAYYGKGVPEFKGKRLQRIEDTRADFEDDMALVRNSSKSEADKQASMEVIRKAFWQSREKILLEMMMLMRLGHKEFTHQII